MALYAAGLEGCPDISISVERVEKTPRKEPSHEARAVLTLSTPHGTVPLYIALSRKTELANVVRLLGSKRELILPTRFSSSAFIKVGSEVEAIRPEGGVTGSVQDAFKREYEELIQLSRGEEAGSCLDLLGFGLLVRVLDVLTKAGN